ncbi:plasma membrane localization protein, partial [Basidiobolus ranarum]
MLISPLMKATHSKAYYTKLVYGILNNISQLDVPQIGSKEVIAWESFEPSNEKSSDESQVNLVALKCFQQLLDSSTPLNLFLIVDSVFSYITKYQLYENSQFPIDVVSFMMSTVASSYCHIIVNEILKLLNECPMDEASHKNVALVKVVESSLNSSTASVGISVLEYLSSFVGHLRGIYRGSEAANMTVEFSPLEMDLKCGLLSAITGLGTHLYYSEQINDMLAFLINKLQPIETAIPVTSFQLDLLKCMSTLTETNKSRNDV